MTRPLGTTVASRGRPVCLLDPTPAMIDLETDVAEGLARLARFTGAVRSGAYSVAQHCVLGADALLRETGREQLALAFLLHDAHEAYIGDIATPVVEALGLAVRDALRTCEPSPDLVVHVALNRLKRGLDAAIHAAAGMSRLSLGDDLIAIKDMDRRMLAAEQRAFGLTGPAAWGEAQARAVRGLGRIRVWPWPEAADAYRDRLRRWAPRLRPGKAAVVPLAAAAAPP